MEVGLIGLGRMGAQLVCRPERRGRIHVVGATATSGGIGA